MADMNLNDVIFITFITLLFTFCPNKKGFNDGELLLEVSDFVLAKYWKLIVQTCVPTDFLPFFYCG